MKSKTIRIATLFASLVSATLPARAATLAWNVTAPTAGTHDITNLIGTTTDAGNVNGGNDNGTYVANNQPAVGQTFTTGNNVGGYQLTAVTLQHVNYSSGTTWYNLGPGWGTGSQFEVRVGTVSGSVFTPLTAEFAQMDSTFANGTINNAGTGRFLTINLGTALMLAANTQYAFTVWSQGPFFETNGTNADNFAGGTAMKVLGNTVSSATGDHVFQVNLTAVPEPSAALFGGLGLLGLLRRRR